MMYAYLIYRGVYHKAVRGKHVRNTAPGFERKWFARCDRQRIIANEEGLAHGAWRLRDAIPPRRRPCGRCWPKEATP